MAIDPNEKTYSEVSEEYVIRFGRVDGMQKMASDLIAYERELAAAEAEIARLKRQISAGYIRRDVSSHYAPGWAPKRPLPDAVDDDWVKTGREAA